MRINRYTACHRRIGTCHICVRLRALRPTPTPACRLHAPEPFYNAPWIVPLSQASLSTLVHTQWAQRGSTLFGGDAPPWHSRARAMGTKTRVVTPLSLADILAHAGKNCRTPPCASTAMACSRARLKRHSQIDLATTSRSLWPRHRPCAERPRAAACCPDAHALRQSLNSAQKGMSPKPDMPHLT